MVANAGKYFIHGFKSVYSNVHTARFDKPEDESLVIIIRPGTVTYLGDWTFEVGQRLSGPNWKIDVAYCVESIATFANIYTGYKKYPFTVSTRDGMTLAVDLK